MTQIEKLTVTKRLIDKLADGVNPLNNCPHEEDYFLNDATLIRCFFHTSQVLERVLQNGGVVGYGRRRNLKPFSITEEEKANVPLSDTPVSITAFVGSINNTVNNPTMRRLTATQVTSWLEQAGFLTTVLNADGKNQRVPTDNAELIGISQVERKNSSGAPFLMNLYNVEAQRFILDNLDSILAALQTPQQSQ
ncbi:MAG: hypothetical protein ACOX1Q_02140 [Eubacteriales bacterium]|jgi:hypothetical protein